MEKESLESLTSFIKINSISKITVKNAYSYFESIENEKIEIEFFTDHVLLQTANILLSIKFCDIVKTEIIAGIFIIRYYDNSVIFLDEGNLNIRPDVKIINCQDKEMKKWIMILIFQFM